MFKFVERAFRQRKMNSMPYDKKVRIVRTCVENTLKSNKGINIPVFQRVNSVMEFIFQRRLVDYYLQNRKMIPVLCMELNCL